ncbi:Endonuclease/exonuclease/phosphatase [Suillus plorans]|uniref:Endonuclease/exonuclease/phosphatase n=1 Tax=Suillus plorans TaxID=116603 RepID=A0A9P7J2N2_9AGAM|nr:Endonuclease/exonuclease/phosphatase [Suillus plorans]KAG1799824.1 Endonuclease/exonuclease/phosphatase [Suillus plorans]
MRGRTSPQLGNSEISKWAAVSQVVKENKIGILCVQETHLTAEHESQIDSIYSRRIKIINSRDPHRPGSSAGIAFILNREIANTVDLETIKIIPGRAMVLKTKWHNQENLLILNIYTPNNHAQHPEFWGKISQTWYEKNLPSPDFMMGDFNITEDILDRAPARPDNDNATEALRDLRHQLNVQDTWRLNNPTSRLFTYNSNTNSLSRLDRIYTAPSHERNTHNWESCTSVIPLDHRMVSVRHAPVNAPYIGKGRWTWPTSLLHDKKLIKTISTLGKLTQQKILYPQYPRHETENPQYFWESFKNQISQEARKAAKEHLNKIRSHIERLESDLEKTRNGPQQAKL